MGSPLDRAVDLLVYAPLGLALTAKDELPKLVEKGRQRSTAQLTMARMIGQFVVTQGQKELTDRLTAFVGSRPSPPPPSSPPPPEPQPAEPAVVHTSGSNGANGQSRSAAPSPPVDALAIHGYDSLSAPQVVQRLAGLSVPELEAVGSYEETHRGRRTILSKVAMLQAERA